MRSFNLKIAIPIFLVTAGISPAQEAAVESAGDLPTVDELLEVPRNPRNPPSSKPDGKLIDRPVEEAESGEPFELAVEGMRQAAARLGEQEDAGIETQRIQEQVIKRLDMLISQMRRQQQQQQQQQARQQDAGSQEQTRGEPNEQNTQGGQDAAQKIGNHSQTQEGQLADQPLEEQFEEWGDLPPRLRDALLEGTRDIKSALYKDLTERYYLRLAEEAE